MRGGKSADLGAHGSRVRPDPIGVSQSCVQQVSSAGDGNFPGREDRPGQIRLQALGFAGLDHQILYLLVRLADQEEGENSARGRRPVALVPRSAFVIDGNKGPVSAAGLAYITFAVNHPNLFRIAFSGHCPRPPEREKNPLIVELFDDLVATGALPADLREGSEEVMWAAVHGMATLVLEGMFAVDEVPRCLAALERMMRLRP